jgi:hypothetical protein
MIPKVPTIEIGTAIAGMTVAHNFRRNIAITITTRPIVRSRVKRTSATLAVMVCVRSDTISTEMPGGSDARSRGNSFLMASTVEMTLAPGCRCTANKTAGFVFSHPPSVSSSGALMARPISRMRIGAP